jgi:predicted alpha/beta hydrolase family esterase
MHPLRGDWCARLDEVLHDIRGPVVLAAHSLGSQLVAAWAAHSRLTARVQGALLVAVPDTEREDVRGMIPGWAPIPQQRLPFAAIQLASANDPFCAFSRAQALSVAWGTQLLNLGDKGHINAESGLGLWPEGQALLQQLQKTPEGKHHGHEKT